MNVDKVRADNEERTDVVRKSGLIINAGGVCYIDSSVRETAAPQT